MKNLSRRKFIGSSLACSTGLGLISTAIPARANSATGYADSRPLAPNDGPENREVNRRVEFRFVEVTH